MYDNIFSFLKKCRPKDPKYLLPSFSKQKRKYFHLYFCSVTQHFQEQDIWQQRVNDDKGKSTNLENQADYEAFFFNDGHTVFYLGSTKYMTVKSELYKVLHRLQLPVRFHT